MICDVKNPRWENAEKTLLGVDVVNERGEELILLTTENNSVPEEAMIFNFAKKNY
ncbi:MAG: hypothetical protein LBC67_07030 [Spirochaetales bacterium]|jgi:hypothetical protein|nr:hypothetical protein [Spirochaetales bacterium]